MFTNTSFSLVTVCLNWCSIISVFVRNLHRYQPIWVQVNSNRWQYSVHTNSIKIRSYPDSISKINLFTEHWSSDSIILCTIIEIVKKVSFRSVTMAGKWVITKNCKKHFRHFDEKNDLDFLDLVTCLNYLLGINPNASRA